MKMLITSGRVRDIIAGAWNEKDVTERLRAHKVRYSFTTEPGFTALKVPARSGALYVYRTGSRSEPFTVRSVSALQAGPRLTLDRLLEV